MDFDIDEYVDNLIKKTNSDFENVIKNLDTATLYKYETQLLEKKDNARNDQNYELTNYYNTRRFSVSVEIVTRRCKQEDFIKREKMYEKLNNLFDKALDSKQTNDTSQKKQSLDDRFEEIFSK